MRLAGGGNKHSAEQYRGYRRLHRVTGYISDDDTDPIRTFMRPKVREVVATNLARRNTRTGYFEA